MVKSWFTSRVSLALVGLLANIPGIITFNAITAPALANEQDDLFELCSRFPFNSQCEGYTAPIPLDNRTGEDARCLLNGSDDSEECKIFLDEQHLWVYTEFGDDLNVLDGDKDTQMLMIPLSQIQSFDYSEDSRINTGAVLAFGLSGLLMRKKTASFGIHYLTSDMDVDTITDASVLETSIPDTTPNPLNTETAGPTELESPETNESPNEPSVVPSNPPQQLLFVMKRNTGRDIRAELEAATGLTADLAL